MTNKLKITERGNGLPGVDELVYDAQANSVYRITDCVGCIHTSQSGGGNHSYYEAEYVGDACDLTEEEWDEVENYGVEVVS